MSVSWAAPRKGPAPCSGQRWRARRSDAMTDAERAAAARVIAGAIAADVFPAAAVEVGSSAAPIWTESFGTLTFDGGSPAAAVDTPFDLASLTKVIATTTIAMDLVRTRRAVARRAGGRRVPRMARHGSRGGDRRAICSSTRRGCRRVCVDAPPAAGASSSTTSARCRSNTRRGRGRSTAISGSSCSGFSRRIAAAPRWRSSSMRHCPARPDRRTTRRRSRAVRSRGRCAARSPRRRGRWTTTRAAAGCCVGEVHDNYAAALGGVAGHAGLFGTAPAVGAFARRCCAPRAATTSPPPFSPDLVARFTREEHGARQLARARLGYDAADLVVRHADVAARVRPRRLHRHVAVDRSGARSLLRAADQPRLRRRHDRRDARRSAARFTTRLAMI